MISQSKIETQFKASSKWHWPVWSTCINHFQRRPRRPPSTLSHTHTHTHTHLHPPIHTDFYICIEGVLYCYFHLWIGYISWAQTAYFDHIIKDELDVCPFDFFRLLDLLEGPDWHVHVGAGLQAPLFQLVGKLLCLSVGLLCSNTSFCILTNRINLSGIKSSIFIFYLFLYFFYFIIYLLTVLGTDSVEEEIYLLAEHRFL